MEEGGRRGKKGDAGAGRGECEVRGERGGSAAEAQPFKTVKWRFSEENIGFP